MSNFERDDSLLEGGLFLSVYIVHMGGTVMICQDLYTVLDGKVCELKGSAPNPTGDALSEMYSCDLVGKYDPSVTYKSPEAVLMETKKFLRKVCP